MHLAEAFIQSKIDRQIFYYSLISFHYVEVTFPTLDFMSAFSDGVTCCCWVCMERYGQWFLCIFSSVSALHIRCRILKEKAWKTDFGDILQLNVICLHLSQVCIVVCWACKDHGELDCFINYYKMDICLYQGFIYIVLYGHVIEIFSAGHDITSTTKLDRKGLAKLIILILNIVGYS